MSESPNEPEIRGELAKRILSEKIQICTECETENTGLAIFCYNCGAELVESPGANRWKFCPNCGSATRFDRQYDQYCESCGTGLYAGIPLPSVGFVDAIKLGFNNYFNFSGRSRRSEYWYWILFWYLALFALGSTSYFLGTAAGTTVMLIFFFGTIIPGLSLSVRRLHDTGRSGLWMLVGLIPYLGWIALLVFHVLDSEKIPNRHGPNPKYGP